ncbi:MAG: DUF4397 domain-containing protein [Bacteroidetes bacterium]|nr:DUF4397 domain-containing protein [Bacteroidota bacterium]
MKHLKVIILSLGVAAMSLSYSSCSKERPHLDNANSNIGNFAKVQVYSATVKAAKNYVYVDGTSVSGVVFGYSAVFPSVANSFLVENGTRSITIKDTTPTTLQTPITFSQNFDAGKSYTIFTYDTILSAKQITVQNNIVIPTDTTCRIRFANFVYSPNPLSNVDIYSFRRIPGTPVFQTTPVLNNTSFKVPDFSGSTAIFSNIASNQVTDYIPYPSLLTDTLYVFATGTTSPLIAKGYVTSLTPGRSYTTSFNGSYQGNVAAKTITTFANY